MKSVYLAWFHWSLSNIEAASEPPGTSCTLELNASEDPHTIAELLHPKKGMLTNKNL